MLDVLSGYVPLYFTDVVGLAPAYASLFLGGFMAASLAADVMLVPLLEQVSGRRLVRVSAGVVACLYPLWLISPWPWMKITLLIAIRLATLGWYQVLKGEAFGALPGKSATVTAVNALGGLSSGVMVWFIGWFASQAGLQAAMWLLWLGPASLVLFVTRK
jgi:MFS transporter, FSR family, fosmidomycin resistance protein